MNALVKICGLANARDVEAVGNMGPDAMGFIFWPRSPRAVDPTQVGEWTRESPAPIRKVGVFVDTPPEGVQEAVETAGLDVVQLHGAYDADAIAAISAPVWRVVHADRLPPDWNRVPVEALLVDSGTVSMPGGTGIRVDTLRAKRLVRESDFPVLLAGGLKADTVGDDIREVFPAGVDVSSGVESRPGVKDLEAVRAFIRTARDAFSSLSS